jgi:hypothetical protein
MNAQQQRAYDRGYRDGAKSNADLAYYVAEHGHAVITGIFAVSPERLNAAQEFATGYIILRAEYGRCPARDFRIRKLRMNYLAAVARDLWRRAA